MKTLQNVRDEIREVKNETSDYNYAVFFGSTEPNSAIHILIQFPNIDKVVKILEDNRDIVDYFSIFELGKIKFYKIKGEDKTYSRNW